MMISGHRRECPVVYMHVQGQITVAHKWEENAAPHVRHTRQSRQTRKIEAYCSRINYKSFSCVPRDIAGTLVVHTPALRYQLKSNHQSMLLPLVVVRSTLQKCRQSQQCSSWRLRTTCFKHVCEKQNPYLMKLRNHQLDYTIRKQHRPDVLLSNS